MSNGNFTPIPHDFLEALCRTRIPGEARQVFDFLLRKTWGWHKDDDMISMDQIREATGLSTIAICKSRKKLVSMNMINTTQLGNKKAISYCIVKDYTLWKILPKKVVLPNKVVTLPKKVVDTTQLATTKDSIYTIQKKKEYDQTMFDRFWAAYPKKKAKGQAEKTWKKIRPDEALLLTMLSAIAKQKHWEQWVKDRGKFIPNPATWLNGKMWLDEETFFQKSSRSGEDLSQRLLAMSNSGRRQ